VTDRATLKLAAFDEYRVVIRMLDGSVVRGFFSSKAHTSLDALNGKSPSALHELLRASCVDESGVPLNVDWSALKAVFFVTSFEGDRDQDSVRFYGNGPMIQSIWVEITFADGEVIEGCVDNSLRHLQNDGFFLHPSSPDINNLLIYVNKSAIVKYRVLGVRMEEQT